MKCSPRGIRTEQVHSQCQGAGPSRNITCVNQKYIGQVAIAKRLEKEKYRGLAKMEVYFPFT